MENSINITGYGYIDDQLQDIIKTLPKDKQKDLEKTCKNIYRAGISEGLSTDVRLSSKLPKY